MLLTKNLYIFLDLEKSECLFSYLYQLVSRKLCWLDSLSCVYCQNLVVKQKCKRDV